MDENTDVIDAISLGQIGYEAYGDDAHWLTYDGRPMPPWPKLGDAVRNHWEAAAETIAESLFADLSFEGTFDDGTAITVRFVDDGDDRFIHLEGKWDD